MSSRRQPCEDKKKELRYRELLCAKSQKQEKLELKIWLLRQDFKWRVIENEVEVIVGNQIT